VREQLSSLLGHQQHNMRPAVTCHSLPPGPLNPTPTLRPGSSQAQASCPAVTRLLSLPLRVSTISMSTRQGHMPSTSRLYRVTAGAVQVQYMRGTFV
jgi:hypothetical protein